MEASSCSMQRTKGQTSMVGGGSKASKCLIWFYVLCVVWIVVFSVHVYVFKVDFNQLLVPLRRMRRPGNPEVVYLKGYHWMFTAVPTGRFDPKVRPAPLSSLRAFNKCFPRPFLGRKKQQNQTRKQKVKGELLRSTEGLGHQVHINPNEVLHTQLVEINTLSN